ncbi:hypothetical protein ARMGADRAFT_556336 [Armillaria gallica]|uniref:Uncharacterized protein n=1 Tax=Armillaria gallica TaxID=47427 RepID=A0A2H3CR16_ARMGA|nr:hypothetical protein ARMGADRAFT_556336 [Armillaria gallica]
MDSDTRRKSQMALDQFRSFFRQDHNPSVPDPPPLLNSDGTLTHGSELSIASYGTETVNAVRSEAFLPFVSTTDEDNKNDPNQLVYDLYTHEILSADEEVMPCTETCFNFHLIGNVHITTVPACHPVISGNNISTDIRHKYPTPM